jgi:NarL family two-component system response regulator LiaR
VLLHQRQQQLPSSSPIMDDLTKRELEVLYWVAQGKTNAQVAEELVISTVTVNSYLRSIYSKFGVSSRTQAIRYAADHDLYDSAMGRDLFGPAGPQGA